MASAVKRSDTVYTVSVSAAVSICIRFESWVCALIKILTLSLITLPLTLQSPCAVVVVLASNLFNIDNPWHRYLNLLATFHLAITAGSLGVTSAPAALVRAGEALDLRRRGELWEREECSVQTLGPAHCEAIGRVLTLSVRQTRAPTLEKIWHYCKVT